MSYRIVRAAQGEDRTARDLKFHLYRWQGTDPVSRGIPSPAALTDDCPVPVVLLHGWGDTGETWQFLVDRLGAQRTCIAIDMRGFGRSERPDDGYWFPDYLADVDALLDQLSPAAPVDLVGHSMGGNVAMLYAGVRPHRVRRLISLEGFGLMRTSPDQAPARYAEWLDEVKQGSEFAVYDSYEQFIAVLARRNPRTPVERVDFIARSWARQRADGRVELWADPKHKRVNPVLYQRDQAEACWRAIQAPVLFVIGGRSELAKHMRAEISEERLQQLLRNVTVATLEDAGHMVHHERPEELARLIEPFLDAQK